MIENATLISIAARGNPTTGGAITYAAATTFNVRCAICNPTDAQIVGLANRAADVTAVMYVYKQRVGSFTPQRLQRVVASIRGVSKTYEVQYVRDQEHGSQSHWEIFMGVA